VGRLFQLGPDQSRGLGDLGEQLFSGGFLIEVPLEFSRGLGIIDEGQIDGLAFGFEGFRGGDDFLEILVAGGFSLDFSPGNGNGLPFVS
jgi:hypothetical protein